MNLEQFTTKSQMAIQQATQVAQSKNHAYVDLPHVLSSIIQVDKDLTNFIFKELQIELDQVESIIETHLNKIPAQQGDNQQIYGSNDFMTLLNQAKKNLDVFKDEFIAIDLLLLTDRKSVV